MSWVREILKSLIDMAIGPEFIRGILNRKAEEFERLASDVEIQIDNKLQIAAENNNSLNGSIYISMSGTSKIREIYPKLVARYIAAGWSRVEIGTSGDSAYFYYNLPEIAVAPVINNYLTEAGKGRHIKVNGN